MKYFQSILEKSDGVNVRVYFLIGQSNMDGRGDPDDLPDYLSGNLPSSYVYNESANAFVKLTATNTSSTLQVGPIAEFAYRMYEEYPDSLHYFIIEAEGSTSLYVDWEPDVGDNYINFETNVVAALSLISSLNYEKIGVLWMQGESDALYQTWADAYEVNQTAFVAAIETITGTSTFIDGRIHEDLPDSTLPYDVEVRTAKDNNFTDGVTDGLIDTDTYTLNTDSIHFDTAGQILLGNAFAQYFI